MEPSAAWITDVTPRDIGSEVVRIGGLDFEFKAKRVMQGLRAVRLTPAEFELLAVLASNAGTVMSRDEILRGMRVEPAPIQLRSLDVRIGRLRRALHRFKGGGMIRTVRGAGYMFEA